MVNQRMSKLVIGMALTASVMAIAACNGCAGKDGGQPPPIEDVALEMQLGAQLLCSYAIPADEVDKAREILIEIRNLSATDPNAAYAVMQSGRANAIVSVKLMWTIIHRVLARHTTTTAQWTDFAVKATGPLAAGCLNGIGPGPLV